MKQNIFITLFVLANNDFCLLLLALASAGYDVPILHKEEKKQERTIDSEKRLKFETSLPLYIHISLIAHIVSKL